MIILVVLFYIIMIAVGVIVQIAIIKYAINHSKIVGLLIDINSKLNRLPKPSGGGSPATGNSANYASSARNEPESSAQTSPEQKPDLGADYENSPYKLL